MENHWALLFPGKVRMLENERERWEHSLETLKEFLWERRLDLRLEWLEKKMGNWKENGKEKWKGSWKVISFLGKERRWGSCWGLLSGGQLNQGITVLRVVDK